MEKNIVWQPILFKIFWFINRTGFSGTTALFCYRQPHCWTCTRLHCAFGCFSCAYSKSERAHLNIGNAWWAADIALSAVVHIMWEQRWKWEWIEKWGSKDNAIITRYEKRKEQKIIRLIGKFKALEPVPSTYKHVYFIWPSAQFSPLPTSRSPWPSCDQPHSMYI